MQYLLSTTVCTEALLSDIQRVSTVSAPYLSDFRGKVDWKVSGFKFDPSFDQMISILLPTYLLEPR